MASGRIKGITIQLDANVKPLQTALSKVDKSLRTTQNNLKDINKLLKLDPKNTELLTQKQKNLRKAISDTKERLAQLKDAQSQVKQGTDDWDALQREIIATEQDLKKLEGDYKDFGSVAKQQLKVVSEKTKAVGQEMKDVGGALTKNVTAPIAGVAAASIAAFKSVDTGADIIIKKTGATGEAAAEMQAIMKRIATTIPTDFETAGNAIGEVSTRFGVVGDDLEELSTKFIKFADLNDTDVVTAIDNVQAAMAAFNMDTSEVGDALDILNVAAQNTGVPVDQLTEKLLANKTQLDEMGLGFNESVAFLSSFEKSGLDTSTMLTGFRAALKNATKQGKPLKDALSDLQTEMQNADSDTEAMQAAMELFGNKAGPAIAKAVSEGKLSLTDFSGYVTDWHGSVDSTFEATLDPIDKFQTTLNNLKIVGAEVGGSLLEILAPAVDKIASVLQTVKEKWDALSPDTQDAIIKAALIAAAIGPVITILGTLVTAIGALLSPIGLVAAAIGGAIAIGVALYKNWDKIKAKAAELKDNVVEKWNGLKADVSTAVDALKSKVETQWNTLKENVTTAAGTIKEKVSTAWNTAKTTVSTAVENMKTAVSEKWQAMKSTVSEKAAAIRTTVSEKFGAVKEKISTALGTAATTVATKFASIYNAITGKLGAARDFVAGAIEKIKGFFNFSWSLPHLKLPHFSIEGSFSLNPPSIPHIGVEWYRKAYNNPYLFTSPTVISGRGFGDGNGSGEIVYGRDALLRDIAQAKGGDTITINVYANEGMNVNQLADQIQKRLTLVQNQKVRAYA